MENVIFKVVSVCVLSSLLMITIKNTIPSFGPVLLLTVGIVCLYQLVPYVENIIRMIQIVGNKIPTVDKYVIVTVKIIGIALVCEFASQLCSDVGEIYLSAKIDLAGKVIIVSMCAPEFLNLIGTVVDMIGSI